MATYKQLRLKKRPTANEELSLDNFEVVTRELPTELKEGEVIGKVLMFSCDPTLRIWATDAKQYMPPVQIGEVMRAMGLAEVVKSRNPDFKVGDRFCSLFGWTEYVVGNPSALGASKDPSNGALAPEVILGPCGLTGVTAYFGLLDKGQLKEGDNVLVSGAAGATGSVVAQIAKLHKCRVVGIAGGAEKCAWLRDECGLDEVIDYKSEDLHKRVGELSNGGYDIYFDNVGGDTLVAALDNLARNARVVLCGAIQGYNQIGEQQPGPHNYINILFERATMSGFIVTDYLPRWGEAITAIAKWISEGKIKYLSDIQEEPIEKAPEVLNRLFSSKNFGKQLHKLRSN